MNVGNVLYQTLLPTIAGKWLEESVSGHVFLLISVKFSLHHRHTVHPVLNPKSLGLCNSYFTMAVLLETSQKARILNVVDHQNVWYGVCMKFSELY
jgi:hypothetical protein